MQKTVPHTTSIRPGDKHSIIANLVSHSRSSVGRRLQTQRALAYGAPEHTEKQAPSAPPSTGSNDRVLMSKPTARLTSIKEKQFRPSSTLATVPFTPVLYLQDDTWVEAAQASDLPFDPVGRTYLGVGRERYYRYRPHTETTEHRMNWRPIGTVGPSMTETSTLPRSQIISHDPRRSPMGRTGPTSTTEPIALRNAAKSGYRRASSRSRTSVSNARTAGGCESPRASGDRPS